MPVNEISKRELARMNHIDVVDLPFHLRLASGAIAGLGYWLLTYPLDAIKARSMSVPYSERLSWLATVRIMAQEGGWRAFTRGITPCVARAVPACASMFATGTLCSVPLQCTSTMLAYCNSPHYDCLCHNSGCGEGQAEPVPIKGEKKKG